MGYKISYGSKLPCEKEQAKDRRFTALLLTILLAGIAMFIHYVYPQVISSVTGILLPGFNERAAEAFSLMIDDMRQGSDAAEAISAFCREVLHDGQLP